jgi:hypothetical protein
MFILRIGLIESGIFEYMWMLTLPVVLNMGFTPINGHTTVSTSISGETPLIESAPTPTEFNNITLFIKSLYRYIPEYTIHNTHYVDLSNLLAEPRYAGVRQKVLYITSLHKGRNRGISHLKSSILNERPLYAFVASGSYINPTKSPRILFHYDTIQFKPIWRAGRLNWVWNNNLLRLEDRKFEGIPVELSESQDTIERVDDRVNVNRHVSDVAPPTSYQYSLINNFKTDVYALFNSLAIDDPNKCVDIKPILDSRPETKQAVIVMLNNHDYLRESRKCIDYINKPSGVFYFRKHKNWIIKTKQSSLIELFLTQSSDDFTGYQVIRYHEQHSKIQNY